MAEGTIQPRKCKKCARAMVHISLEIESEMRTLHSCSHCDVREWEAATGSTSLQGVLNELSDSAGR